MASKPRSSICSKEKGKGNTNSSPACSKKWCFTANNYSTEEIDAFCSICSKIGHFFFGYEVGESGTPHLQGFIEFTTKARPLTAFKGSAAAKWHWEKMKGSLNESLVYCGKDGNTHTNNPKWKVKKSIGCKKFDPIVLRPWQIKAEQEVLKLAKDDRQIMWIHDNGNTGKSVFARYLVEEYSAIILGGSSRHCLSTLFKMDVKPEIIIYALPREKEDYLSYACLEQIRDGIFFSGFGTEGTGMCNFGFHPVVIVLCNFPPDRTKFSEDRWLVFADNCWDV